MWGNRGEHGLGNRPSGFFADPQVGNSEQSHMRGRECLAMRLCSGCWEGGGESWDLIFDAGAIPDIDLSLAKPKTRSRVAGWRGFRRFRNAGIIARVWGGSKQAPGEKTTSQIQKDIKFKRKKITNSNLKKLQKNYKFDFVLGL